MGMATVGTIASFINYTRLFGRPLNDIANLYNTIQAAIAGAERVFEIIDEEPEIDAPNAQPLLDIKGDVCFDDVSFGYEPDVPVLETRLPARRAGPDRRAGRTDRSGQDDHRQPADALL